MSRTMQSTQQVASVALTKQYPIVIPYQIEYASNLTGRHIGFTKRRIRFKFGFAHVASVMEGKSGTDCRGIEMEVQLVWSVTGGKFNVFFNLQQMHQSIVKGMSSKVEHTFVIPEGVFPGGHLVHVTAQQMRHSQEGHQFNMKVDGQSYFDFLKIYELGTPVMHSRYGEGLKHLRMQMDKGLVDLHAYDTSTQMVVHGDPAQTVDYLLRGRAKYIPGSRSKSPRNEKEAEEESRRMLPKSRYEEQQMLSEAMRESLVEAHSPSRPSQSDKSDVATTAEQERRMMAQARLASLRDMKEMREHQHVSSPSNSTNLQTVPENNDGDFIDLGGPVQNNNVPRPEIYRSTSSITNDFDDDTVYSHLDPRQSYQTQQNMNLPFRLQSQPPTYADSNMGDIVGHNPSFASPAQKSVTASFSAAYPMLSPSNVAYGAPPPPTLDDLNMQFAVAPQFAQPNNQPHQHANYNTQQTYSPHTAPNSNNFAVPPPVPARHW